MLVQYSGVQFTTLLTCVVLLDMIYCSHMLNTVHLLVKSMLFDYMPLSERIAKEA